MIRVKGTAKTCTNDATAATSDVTSGKVFYNNNDRQIGTLEANVVVHECKYSVSFNNTFDKTHVCSKGIQIFCRHPGYYRDDTTSVTKITDRIVPMYTDAYLYSNEFGSYIETDFSSTNIDSIVADGTYVAINKDISKIKYFIYDGVKYIVPTRVVGDDKRTSTVESVYLSLFGKDSDAIAICVGISAIYLCQTNGPVKLVVFHTESLVTGIAITVRGSIDTRVLNYGYAYID